MENKETNTNVEKTQNESCDKETCCSNLFSTTDSEGRKKPSPLLWAILAVFLIGGLGIISSKKQNQKEMIQSLKDEESQLQACLIQTKLAQKNKFEENKKAQIVEKEQAMAQKIKQMEEAHNKQMQEAQNAIQNIQATYNQKIQNIVKEMRSEQERKAQEVPNPELNFQLRGLSNVKIQFNRSKDISNIEIIQPEPNNSWGDKKKNWDKKWKNDDNKGMSYTPCTPCEPQSKWDCEENTSCDMPTKKESNDNKWQCAPMYNDTNEDNYDCNQ